MHAYGAVYETSKAFEAHLAKQGLAAALKKAGLKRRLKHEIFPHVCFLEAVPTLGFCRLERC